MGDGDAERDRGGHCGGHRGDTDGRGRRNFAGTSASSPAGSGESGADCAKQPGLQETDHCRRILVRGKRALPGSPDLPNSASRRRYLPLAAPTFTLSASVSH